jgi:hypothetical protein
LRKHSTCLHMQLTEFLDDFTYQCWRSICTTHCTTFFLESKRHKKIKRKPCNQAIRIHHGTMLRLCSLSLQKKLCQNILATQEHCQWRGQVLQIYHVRKWEDVVHHHLKCAIWDLPLKGHLHAGLSGQYTNIHTNPDLGVDCGAI